MAGMAGLVGLVGGQWRDSGGVAGPSIVVRRVKVGATVSAADRGGVAGGLGMGCGRVG
jgi:hypothetical protein